MGPLQFSWQPCVQAPFWGLQIEPLTQFPQVLLQSVPNSPELHSVKKRIRKLRFDVSLHERKKPNCFFKYSYQLNI